jgi:hypothetical protein
MSNLFETAETVESLLAQVVGAGSVCWTPRPEEHVFNEREANMVVTHALLRLSEILQEEFKSNLEAHVEAMQNDK